jgi:general secretion pathway protein D
VTGTALAVRLLLFFALALLAPDVPAGAKARSARRSKRVRLELDQADLRDVARLISDLTGKNILLSDRARGGKITIFSPRPVTAAEAYRAFLGALQLQDLTVVRAGKFLKIVPLRDAKEMATEVYAR